MWDIHSPHVPSTKELTELTEAAVTAIPAFQVWINPGCGLRTRAYPETKATFENLVNTAEAVRDRLS